MNRSRTSPIICTALLMHLFACADGPRGREQTAAESTIEPIPVEVPDPVPLPRRLTPARLIPRASLALTGSYPPGKLLEEAANGGVDVEEWLEETLSSTAFVRSSA